MMRFKYVWFAGAMLLVLPLAAQAQLLRGSRCGGTFGNRGCGGSSIGGRVQSFFGAAGDAIANSPGPVWTGGNHQGFGFMQPPFQASPWYLYWPYDQHFQTPAPIGAPHFAPQAYAHPSMNQYFGGGHGGALPPGAPVPPPAKK